MIAERLDQFILLHRGPTVDSDLGRPAAQVLNGPLLIRTRFAAAPTDGGARTSGGLVRDPGGLPFARAIVAECFVKLVILDAWARLRLGHGGHSFR